LLGVFRGGVAITPFFMPCPFGIWSRLGFYPTKQV